MIQINMILVQLKQKADVNVLEHAKQYTDDQISIERKDWTKKIEQLNTTLGNFRIDFDSFRDKDFMALEARVTALEKRLAALSIQVSGIKMPEHVSSGNNFDANLL